MRNRVFGGSKVAEAGFARFGESGTTLGEAGRGWAAGSGDLDNFRKIVKFSYMVRTHERRSQRGGAGPGTGRTYPWWSKVANLVVQGANSRLVRLARRVNSRAHARAPLRTAA